MIHQIKCWPEFFRALKDGRKTFDARKNDRNYQVGDQVIQNEWTPADGLHSELGEYSGRTLRFVVTYILKGSEQNNLTGVQEGFCVLALQKIK
jgi:hypothetical protein